MRRVTDRGPGPLREPVLLWAGATATLLAAGFAMRSMSTREAGAVSAIQARSPRRDRVARVASTLSDVPASITHGVLAAGVLAVRSGDPRRGAGPLAALLAETAATLIIGTAVRRERPRVPHLDREQPTSSFPSGHQAATVALATVYWHAAANASPTASRAIRAAVVLWPVLQGWSRVYVGLHYPSDILAGSLVGWTSGRLARAIQASVTEARPPTR